MPQRYGITNNPDRREQQLKGEFLGVKNFKIEQEFPNQETAQKWENKKKNQHPEGSKTEGSYCGYSQNYTCRKS